MTTNIDHWPAPLASQLLSDGPEPVILQSDISPVAELASAQIAPEAVSRFERFRSWVGERKTHIAIGIAGLSLAATLSNNPMSELKDDVIAAAPWVGGGVAASEVAFATGAAMMAGSVGSKIGNPWTIKERIPDIAQRAQDSKLFWTGFWTNTTGAVGDFAVISAGVLKEMPVESYPLLALTLADLGMTVAVRKALKSGIRNKAQNDAAEAVTGEEA